MSLIAPVTESKSVQLPEGSYTARIFRIIDLGTQSTPFGEKRNIRIGFETPTKTHVWKEEKGEQPFAIDKEMALYLSAEGTEPDRLSTLSKVFKSATGSNGQGQDIFSLIGKMLTITISHKESKGKQYANITGFAPVNADVDTSQDKFKAYNKPTTFNAEDPSPEVFESLPDFIKDKIKASPEFQASQRPETTKKDSDLPEIDVEELTTQMPF